jgi:hypothetical protein
MPGPSTDHDPHADDAAGSAEFSEHFADEDELDRVETLIRILYSLLFFLIIQVIEAALAVIVFFQLIFALVTNSTPNPAVNTFARRVIEYAYQIAHYLTYNRDQPPFPFDELPSDPRADDRIR